MNDDPQHREDPREVGYPPAAEQPVDVDAYEAAGVARVEARSHDEPPDDHDCECGSGYCTDPDEWCDHCEWCCDCTPCMYARVA